MAALVDPLAGTGAKVTIALAVDLPLVPVHLLTHLGRAAGEIGISIVPVRDGRFEPFAAVWHVSALPVLRAGLAAGHSLQRICADLQVTGRLWPQAMAKWASSAPATGT